MPEVDDDSVADDDRRRTGVGVLVMDFGSWRRLLERRCLPGDVPSFFVHRNDDQILFGRILNRNCGCEKDEPVAGNRRRPTQARQLGPPLNILRFRPHDRQVGRLSLTSIIAPTEFSPVPSQDGNRGENESDDNERKGSISMGHGYLRVWGL